MLILTAEQIRQCLPMGEAIEGMKRAYAAVSSARAELPLRTRLSLPDDGLALFMPAYLHGDEQFGVKVVTVNPKNENLPVVQAAVLVFSAETGAITALIDGASLTAIRTGAGGGASADLLSRRDSKVLSVLGSGVQARSGIEAVCAVRDIQQVRVYSRNEARREQFVAEMADVVSAEVVACESSADAISSADIVYTATDSAVPTFDGRLIRPGTHVIGVGSYTPEMQEVDFDVVGRARVFVDAREAVLAEAGDVVRPVEQGIITPDDLIELGEVVLGEKDGRTSDDQITFFKSVGVATQDVVAAQIVLKNFAP